MAETFRKSKISKYHNTLLIRRAVTKKQLEEDHHTSDEKMRANKKGYIEAIELILEELEHEFNLERSDVIAG